MSGITAIDAWHQRDAQIEERFDRANSIQVRHMLGKLFGKNRPPNLNRYRDHLLAGLAIKALPSENSVAVPQLVEGLATEDHEARVSTKDARGLQIAFARRAMVKLSMDLEAGKVPFFADSDELDAV